MSPAVNPLFAVRDRLRDDQLTTPERLAAELDLPLAVVKDVLDHFRRRGQVAPVTLEAVAGCGVRRCGSCRLCFGAGTPATWVRWLGPPAKADSPVPG